MWVFLSFSVLFVVSNIVWAKKKKEIPFLRLSAGIPFVKKSIFSSEAFILKVPDVAFPLMPLYPRHSPTEPEGF